MQTQADIEEKSIFLSVKILIEAMEIEGMT